MNNGSFAERMLRILALFARWRWWCGAHRVAKMHRIYLYKSFPGRQPNNEWLFCEKKPAT